ncbi:MAG: DNA-processing protein DprA [Armatimonadetes bacterium]|nr:DNA-processing protein DprA [Candidatus Hippobium faecium]
MFDKLITLLRIARIELNPKEKQAVCSNVADAEEFFSLTDEELKEFHFTLGEIQKFHFYKDADLSQDAETVKKLGVKLISVWDEEYPKRLKEIYDPPLVLYVMGEIPSDNNMFIGVVGSRNCNQYGKTACELVTGKLASNGVVIVSGGAYGIDSVAHRITLSVKGKTVAVLGCGIDVPYPAANADLFKEIAENGGAVISEAPLGCQPMPYRFPVRNRIISGLSDGVLVCQAPVASGSLITAGCALEQGKEVFAIPGNITEKKSSGCNKLIKEGAVLVSSADDIMNEFNLELAEERDTLNFLQDEKEIALYGLLSLEPVHIEELSYKSGMDIVTVKTTLMMMEINGYVKSVPVNCYIRSK